MEITQQQYDEAFASLNAYYKEIEDNNDRIIKSLGRYAKKHFERLVEGCSSIGKIELVDNPYGDDQKENCGCFKSIHVRQWSVGDSGDSYAGSIYAKVKDQWLRIPYEC